MGIILCVLLAPVALVIYLILFGSKECYYCGDRLNMKEKPIHVKGKRSCRDCLIHPS